MNKYEKAIQEIDKESYNNFPEQITIDIIQDVVHQLITDADEDEEAVTRDSIGAWVYRISILLDVFNPEMKKDIALLQKLHDVLEEWRDDVEFVHKTLGGTY